MAPPDRESKSYGINRVAQHAPLAVGTPGGRSQGGQAGPENGNAAAGKAVFSQNCAGCHGTTGHGGNGGPDISDPRSLETIIGQVTNGGGGMPAFKGTLDEQQIGDVAAYVFKEVEGQKP